MTAVSVLAGLFWAGVGLLILIVGLPIVVLSLFVARGFGLAERYLLWLTGLPEIVEPEWNRDATESTGFWSTLTRPLRNGHYWTYLLYGMIVSPIVSTITFALTTLWLSVGLAGLTYWFWGLFHPARRRHRRVGSVRLGGAAVAVRRMVELGGRGRPVPDRRHDLHDHPAVGDERPSRGSPLDRPWPAGPLALVTTSPPRSRAEAAARGPAVQAESAGLRRLERDIHDGPQQRLVRLQLDLAALERRAEAGDTDAAADLAREARGARQGCAR